jgi:hypothetical protein
MELTILSLKMLPRAVLQGVSIAVLTTGLEMTPAEVEVFLASVRKDISERKIHAYTLLE